MAKKKKIKDCYQSPLFEQGDKDGYDYQVKHTQDMIDEVAKRIYNDDFPTDRKCSNRINAFNGCTPIYLEDKSKEVHLEQIRNALESIFMEGRMFGMLESRFNNL